MAGWEALGGVPGARLVEARLQLHQAAQPAAAVGKLLLPHQEDYGEQSFRWLAGSRCLAQGRVAAPTPFRAALRPAPLALLLLGEDGGILRQLPLGGRTLAEAYDWLAARLAELLGGPLPGELERPEGLPFHPVAEGGRFDAGDEEAFAELARLFADADLVLTAWAATWQGASAVRCWPHHFDLATLAPLPPPAPAPLARQASLAQPAPLASDTPPSPAPPGSSPDSDIAPSPAAELSAVVEAGDPEHARTLGVGMVPGDEGRPEPYFYVLPWPRPENPRLPPLGRGGSWNTGHWFGAVLEAPRFMGERAARAQAEAVEAFLHAAVTACRSLLEPSPAPG
jgi:hypothetical protein